MDDNGTLFTSIIRFLYSFEAISLECCSMDIYRLAFEAEE